MDVVIETVEVIRQTAAATELEVTGRVGPGRAPFRARTALWEGRSEPDVEFVGDPPPVEPAAFALALHAALEAGHTDLLQAELRRIAGDPAPTGVMPRGGLAGRFGLGAVVATPAALAALASAGQDARELLARHAAGDWGEVSPDDRRANEEALRSGARLLSAYRLRTGETVWVITEAAGDGGRRESTCVLLPDDY